MDKRSLLAMVLIAVIVMGWLYWQNKNYEENAENLKQQTNTAVDSLESNSNNEIKNDSSKPKKNQNTLRNSEGNEIVDTLRKEKNIHIDKFGNTFAPFATGNRKKIIIENDLVKITLLNKGASVYRWELKQYDKWDGVPVQLIPYDSQGELFMEFLSLEGKRISSNELYFDFKSDKENFVISGDDSLVIEAKLQIASGKSITKKLKFYGNKYVIDQDIVLENLEDVIAPRYDLKWTNGLKYQEYNSIEESQEAKAIANMNGDPANLDASDTDEEYYDSYEGQIDYVAINIKYFTAAIIPQPWQEFRGTVDLSGYKENLKDDGAVETYNISIRVPYNGGVQHDDFLVYIGPLDYDLVKEYGLKDLVDFGWRYGIRQIGEYFMMPIFKFIHNYVPNFGVSIILFSILMKLLLYPLSITQMRSARKMQIIAPEMQKIRDKYKDDQTKQQQAIMKMYGEYGVNPASGCLPLLLQMPILFALYSVLRRAIELRQADFIWWINDLSRPDILIDFNFSFLGISHISGLALLMGVTMFFQQKLTVTDPRQKSMIYVLPVVFTIMFSNFPAGLNLYYFMFNLLSVAQQIYMNKFSPNKLTLADLKKQPKKEGWLQKKMREAQELAEAQGRSVPGQNLQSQSNKNNMPKRNNKRQPQNKRKRK